MKVLCIAPRFAPVNAADAHRVRLLLPHWQALGHQVEVLAVDPRDVGMPVDDWLAARLPAATPVHRVRVAARRRWGWGGLDLRAWWPLARTGDALLRAGGFDLVFFSTTDFLLHGLGLRWRSRWGVPFCMDFQDPWVNDYYRRHRDVTPPGGRLKYALRSALDRWLERRVVDACGGFLSVSSAYLDDLAARHGDQVRGKPQRVAPFPADPDEAAALPPPSAIATGCWRYVGRGGADMAPAARGFFRAWRLAVDRGLLAPHALRFEAIGTRYDGASAPSIAPLAQQQGLQSQVAEQPQRIGYREMLETLAGSGALVVFGSNDPAYTASKIYPYLLSGRPVLAILHGASPAVPVLRSVGGAVLVTFDAATPGEALAEAIVRDWFAVAAPARGVPLDRAAFERYSARHQAREVAGWWQQIVDREGAHAR